MRLIAPSLISLSLLLAGLAFGAQSTNTVAQPKDPFAAKRSVAAKTDYLLFLPSGYETSTNNWPLILFLHGSGECGTNLNLVKRNGTPKYVLTHLDFPFILVAPQTQGGWDARPLMTVLEDVSRQYRVENSQIYLTGLSLGGGGTWALAAKYPEKFAAIVPVSGVGDPGSAKQLATLPIWVFHGGKDPIISVDWSRKMVAALQTNGGTVKYTEYPGAKHNIWARTYNNPDLYAWLLNQKRAP